MTHGSLFSGMGGFDLAAEWMGWENVFHCEINPFCKQLLKHYWPYADSLDDIKKTDFTKWRGQIDVLSGGFPCQPYSVAGLRKGKEDARHLWPEMLRATREIQPRWIVGENVRGLTSWSDGLVFEEVCADLENEGYKVLPVVLPAAGVDAPHRRERIWFIAHAVSDGHWSERFGKDRCPERETKGLKNKRQRVRYESRRNVETGITPDSNEFDRRGGAGRQNGSEINNSCKGTFTDSSIAGCEKRDIAPEPEPKRHCSRICAQDADYWQNFPTQSPVCIGDDGLPAGLDATALFGKPCKPAHARLAAKWRNETIKAVGNAVVPQVVLQLFETIDLYELL